MSTAAGTEVAAYAERVRAALADLPADRREDLLADLADHLAEVAGEEGEGAGQPLEARLGPPERYAAELRAAAGLPPAAGQSAPGGPARLDLGRWRRSTVEFLPELRPAWWVLRALLVAWFLGWQLLASALAFVLVALLAVPASVALGRREQANPRLRRRVLALTLVVLLLPIPVLGVAPFAFRAGSVEGPPQPVYQMVPGLEGVTNIHPYSSDGKPLTDVLLYDQDGNPIVLGERMTPDGDQLTVVPRYGADGRVVDNVYPQEQVIEDVTGQLPPEGPERRRVVPPSVKPPALQPR